MPRVSLPKIRFSSLRRTDTGQLLILWGTTEAEIPPAPSKNRKFTKEDVEYWYEQEYGGWHAIKQNIPESPRTGAQGKKIIYITPDTTHPYMELYAKTIRDKCTLAGMEVTIMDCQWSAAKYDTVVTEAITEMPDLILLNPVDPQKSDLWFRQINSADIPIIGVNMIASRAGHTHLVAWTGPDDWGQSRELARMMADNMGKKGNYTILGHYRGNSSYYARKWGVITELKRYAPEMVCLDTKPGLVLEDALSSVKNWLETYGNNLNGIFSADDGIVLKNITDLLESKGRTDVCCVGVGSNISGTDLVLRGKVFACAYQSPIIDAECAIQTAIDWFEGLPVEPIRYIPRHIITQEDAHEFFQITPTVSNLNLDHLSGHITNLDWKGCYNFFGDLYEKLLVTKVIPLDMFQGICLEILMNLSLILHEEGVSVKETLGSYENLAKHLLKDNDISSVLDWLNTKALNTITALLKKINRKTPIQEIISYIDCNYTKPMSIKSLSYQFSISQAYLGQIFKKEVGIKFNDYINTKRINKAKQLLQAEHVKVSQIAEELGFTDPAYFYKIFKKQTGISTHDFMAKHR